MKQHSQKLRPACAEPARGSSKYTRGSCSKVLLFVFVQSRKVAEAMITFVVDGCKHAQAHLLLVRGSQQASGKERRHSGAVERGQLQP